MTAIRVASGTAGGAPMVPASLLNLILTGVGGQGNLFASQIIARAALLEGLSVRIAETYGVTQRGGPVYSQVRIGREVYGPLIPKGQCDYMIGMEPIETLRRAAEYLAPGGHLTVNARVNVPLETKLGRQPSLGMETILRDLKRLGAGEILSVDARAQAEGAGGIDTVNIFMVGTLYGLEGFPIAFASMGEAIRITTKPRSIEKNLSSLTAGREYALRARRGKQEGYWKR